MNKPTIDLHLGELHIRQGFRRVQSILAEKDTAPELHASGDIWFDSDDPSAIIIEPGQYSDVVAHSQDL